MVNNLERLRTRADAPPLAAHDSVADPYYGCGCHPDNVARLWDELGRALPVDCRRLVYGRPALVRPDTETVLAIAWGTRYALHLPGEIAAEAVAAGAPTSTQWSGGERTDLTETMGEGWVFGIWRAEEADWLKRAWEAAG